MIQESVQGAERVSEGQDKCDDRHSAPKPYVAVAPPLGEDDEGEQEREGPHKRVLSHDRRGTPHPACVASPEVVEEGEEESRDHMEGK